MPYKKRKTLDGKWEPGVLLKVDARTKLYHRLKELYDEICSDLGGEQNLSRIQRTLVERYAFQSVLIAEWEAQIALDPLGPKAADLVGKATQATNAMQGLAQKLGLKKQQQAASLRAYVKGTG